MKNFIVILMLLSFIGIHISGCSTFKSLKPEFGTKTNTGMFSGCVSGVIVGGILGNVYGALLGGILGTTFGTVVGDYFDKKTATREEALIKHPLRNGEEKLLVEESLPVSQIVSAGSTVLINVSYTVLGPADIKKIKITETRIFFNEQQGLVKLDERKVLRTQGSYRSGYSFTMPDNISKGDAIIITIISNARQTKTVTSPVKIG